jgi:hypothetical protein
MSAGERTISGEAPREDNKAHQSVPAGPEVENARTDARNIMM